MILGDVESFGVTCRVLYVLSIGIAEGGEADVHMARCMFGMNHMRSAMLRAELGRDVVGVLMELLFRHAVFGIRVDGHESFEVRTPGGGVGGDFGGVVSFECQSGWWWRGMTMGRGVDIIGDRNWSGGDGGERNKGAEEPGDEQKQ